MLDHLPLSDINMLVSYINTQLRDREFDSLDDICSYYEVDITSIISLLSDHGYSYIESQNKISAI